MIIIEFFYDIVDRHLWYYIALGVWIAFISALSVPLQFVGLRNITLIYSQM